MGGNLTVLDINNVEVQATKIDLKAVRRSKFKKQLYSLLQAINTLHEVQFGYKIWGEINSDIFNGSSASIMDDNISDTDIYHHKPFLGDVDLAVPSEHAGTLLSLLDERKGQKITSKVELIGINRTIGQSVGTQINAIFKFKDPEDYLVQVDFELLSFEDGKPTEWARFSHSSAWSDILNGVKAVHHKFLIRSLVGAISARPDIVIATPKSTWDNVKISASSRKGDITRMLKFSVDHGVRVAYSPLVNSAGETVQHEGKQVFKEIPTIDSDYKRNVEDILELAFGPENSADVEKFWTFDGVVELIGQHLNAEQQQDVVERYLTLLWGVKPQRAQELERGNPDEDLKVKSAGWNRLKQLTGVVDPAGFEKILSDYYEGYRV